MENTFHISQQTIQQYRSIQQLLDQLDPDAAPQAVITPESPRPKGEIIVFPGSFNPPTTAHLAMLERAEQFARTQPKTTGEVYLYAAVSKRITDKENVDRPSLLDRIVLIEHVVRNHLARAGVMLFNRGLYVEQADAVHTAFPDVKRLYFLIGYDKIVQILDPRYYKDRDAALWELFKLADVLVAPRGQDGPEALDALLAKPENQAFRAHIHALPFDPAYRDISSTRIREQSDRFTEDEPPEVQQFIRETHAYGPPRRQADGTVIDKYGAYEQAIQWLLKEGFSTINREATNREPTGEK
jgi:nicotinamide-nucleotide adenylyltransferase